MISCFLDWPLKNCPFIELGNCLIRDLPLNLEKIQKIFSLITILESADAAPISSGDDASSSSTANTGNKEDKASFLPRFKSVLTGGVKSILEARNLEDIAHGEQHQILGNLVANTTKSIGNKFTKTSWHPIQSGSQLKTYTAKIDQDSKGRNHYRDLKSGKFSKSPFDMAMDNFKSGALNPAKINGLLKLAEQKDYWKFDFLRSAYNDNNVNIETGGRVYFGGSKSVASSIFGSDNSQNVGWFVKGDAGINIGAGTAETSFGNSQLDLNFLSGSVNLNAKINSDKKITDVNFGVGAKAAIIDINGQFKSKKFCSNDTCCTAELNVSTGIGYVARFGFGYKKDNEKGTGSFIGTAGLSSVVVPVIFGADIIAKCEPNEQKIYNDKKSSDNNDVSPRPVL